MKPDIKNLKMIGNIQKKEVEQLTNCMNYWNIKFYKGNSKTSMLKQYKLSFNPIALRKSKIVYNFGLSG